MKRRGFLRGLIGAALAVAVAPLARLASKIRLDGASSRWDQFTLTPLHYSVPIGYTRLADLVAGPRKLHGPMEGWEVEENCLLSRNGQTHFVNYDVATGLPSGAFTVYTLVDEELGTIRAWQTTSLPQARSLRFSPDGHAIGYVQPGHPESYTDYMDRIACGIITDLS